MQAKANALESAAVLLWSSEMTKYREDSLCHPRESRLIMLTSRPGVILTLILDQLSSSAPTPHIMKPVPSRKLMPPQDLLLFNQAHRVVICTTCEYAIQPAAIARHLKEIHAIHRHHRRPYTEYAAGLDLRDPSELLCDPFTGDFPVPGLPTTSGFQCLSPGCGHLCATVKRMQSHWVSSHHASGCAALDWQSVPLQTFFKGNLLRYFTHPALSVLRLPEEPEVCTLPA